MKKYGIIGLTTFTLLIPSTAGFAATDGICSGEGEITCLAAPVNEYASEQEAYSFLQDISVFHGYTNGDAHLERKTNRAQVAATLYRMFSLEIPKINAPYSDLHNHWALDEINAIHTAGWMQYKGKAFKPNQTITLQELAEILAKVAKLNTNEYASIWLPADSEYQDDLAAVLTEKLLEGSDDYRAEATRGDLAVALYQLYHYMEKKEPGSVMSALVPSLNIEQNEDKWMWSFDILNRTEETQTVTFSSGLNFDYILYKDGEKVEQFSDGKQFIMIYVEKELEAGDALNFKGNFSDLAPGEYKLEIWLAAKEWPQVRKTLSFEVEK